MSQQLPVALVVSALLIAVLSLLTPQKPGPRSVGYEGPARASSAVENGTRSAADETLSFDPVRFEMYRDLTRRMRRDPPQDFQRVNLASRELDAELSVAPASDVPIIEWCLEREPEFSTRRALVRGLARIGGAESMRVIEDHLWRVLDRNDAETGVEAVTLLSTGLAGLGAPAAERLAGWLEWGPPGLQAYVLESFATLPVDARIPYFGRFTERLRDENSAVRRGAAFALRGIPAAAEPLCDRLSVETEVELLSAIVAIIGTTGSRSSIPVLLEFFESGTTQFGVRWQIIDALEAIGGVEAARTGGATGRGEAVRALRAIEELDIAPRLQGRASQSAGRLESMALVVDPPSPRR